MNAKEYLKQNDLPDELISIQRDGFIESHYLSTLISKYHTQKSKEEAVEKGKIGFIANVPTGFVIEFIKHPLLAERGKAICLCHPDDLAAFGKEEG